MAVGALNVVLLFSLVTGLSALPVLIESTPQFAKEGNDRTLPTELQPPPLDDKEHHATVFILNLYAVKNSSSNVSEEMFQNEIIEAAPELLEPLVTVFLVVENDEDEKEDFPVDLDEFAEVLKDKGYGIDKINHKGNTKVLRMKLPKEEEQSMVESALKPIDKTKSREKRTICLKCGGRGGWGGRGGGGWGKGGGGGGCRTCGGGRGGGWSSSSASAHASSSSGSWGK